MSNKKKIAGLIALSLIAGGGIAGGLYVANTPTNISSRASSSLVSPTKVPGLRAPASPTISAKPTALPTMSTPTIATEDAIIKAFGSSDVSLDQNGDGTVNAIDLQIFRSKK